jgi:hypothetical protein
MSSATSNIFINEILRIFPWKEDYGIYSSNKIPASLSYKKNFTIICNESRQEEEGTHFIIIIRRNETILYLDPLAIYLEIHNDIPDFINACNVKTVFKLTKPIQHIDSWMCGLFTTCLALYFNPLAKNTNFQTFVTRNIKDNDCICINNIVQFILQNKS